MLIEGEEAQTNSMQMKERSYEGNHGTRQKEESNEGENWLDKQQG